MCLPAATARRTSLGGEGNALYPVLSSLVCDRPLHAATAQCIINIDCHQLYWQLSTYQGGVALSQKLATVQNRGFLKELLELHNPSPPSVPTFPSLTLPLTAGSNPNPRSPLPEGWDWTPCLIQCYL